MIVIIMAKIIKVKVKLGVKIKDNIKEKTFYRCEWGMLNIISMIIKMIVIV